MAEHGEAMKRSPPEGLLHSVSAVLMSDSARCLWKARRSAVYQLTHSATPPQRQQRLIRIHSAQRVRDWYSKPRTCKLLHIDTHPLVLREYFTFRPLLMQLKNRIEKVGFRGFFSDWIANSYPPYRPSDRIYSFCVFFLETRRRLMQVSYYGGP